MRFWNWKAAVCSSVIRGILFFAVALPAGRAAATSVAIAEMIFRVISSGFFGALTQWLSELESVWLSALLATLVLPALNQVAEYALHAAIHSARLMHISIASLIFTVISTLFNLYIQRHGLLITGEERAKSLAADLKQVPAAIVGFVALPFRMLLRRP